MKNSWKIVGMAAFIIIAILVIASIAMYISYNNEDAKLRSQAKEQIGVVELTHDKMFKILQQKAGVANEYKEAFDSIYTHIMEGRYSGGSRDGSLMKWIQESNPTFNDGMYQDLMTSIEVERTEFLNAQKRVLDIQNQHNILLTTWPGDILVSDTTRIQYTPISSTRSKNVMETKVDDDIDLFKK